MVVRYWVRRNSDIIKWGIFSLLIAVNGYYGTDFHYILYLRIFAFFENLSRIFKFQ